MLHRLCNGGSGMEHLGRDDHVIFGPKALLRRAFLDVQRFVIDISALGELLLRCRQKRGTHIGKTVSAVPLGFKIGHPRYP